MRKRTRLGDSSFGPPQWSLGPSRRLATLPLTVTSRREVPGAAAARRLPAYWAVPWGEFHETRDEIRRKPHKLVL
jgi:hypothetical protein